MVFGEAGVRFPGLFTNESMVVRQHQMKGAALDMSNLNYDGFFLFSNNWDKNIILECSKFCPNNGERLTFANIYPGCGAQLCYSSEKRCLCSLNVNIRSSSEAQYRYSCLE